MLNISSWCQKYIMTLKSSSLCQKHVLTPKCFSWRPKYINKWRQKHLMLSKMFMSSKIWCQWVCHYIKNTSWRQKVSHDVRNTWIQKVRKYTSWRQKYIKMMSNSSSWRQKYVMTSKVCHDVKTRHDVRKFVMRSKLSCHHLTSWQTFWHHDVFLSWCQKVCHDVSNTS